MTQKLPTDLPNLEAIRQGDRREWTKTVEMYYQSLFYKADNLLNNRHFAKDIVFEVYERTWNKRNEFESPAHLVNYLYDVVKWLCYKQNKELFAESVMKNKYAAMLGISLNDYDGSNETELTERVREAVKKLPDKYRRIIELKVYKDMKYEEIVQEMDISMDNAYKLYSRAVEKLKILLTKE